MEALTETRCWDGRQMRFAHRSAVLSCDMTFSLYLPPQAEREKVPVLYWLSGLTCTDENFVQKAGAQRYAAEYGVAIVTPDTSPRGDDVPDDPEGAWDFGLGAGFYLNATQAPWNTHYRMYDYITLELPQLIAENFPVLPERCSIFGHSMGGHGALSIALRNPDQYQSVSAFSPIVAPTHCPWGRKALGYYLGDSLEEWNKHDSCALIANGARQLPMLVDQGEADDFLEEQLKTQLLEQVCEETGYQATIRRQTGYDHSYFFIASFIGSHIGFHAQALKQR
jgi:S-formylglutathione hydrolase